MTESKKLTEIFFRLPSQDQQSLLDFAQFLTQKNKHVQVEFPLPSLKQRAEGETVIAAIKRLKKSYSMLNMDSMIDETSSYMTQYTLQGRDINAVIDDLEASFQRHYELQKAEFENA